MLFLPAAFSADGSLFIARSPHNQEEKIENGGCILAPFSVKSAETLNANEAILKVRAFSGVTAENSLKNSHIIRTGRLISNPAPSGVNTNTRIHTGTEELSNMYSWLHVISQQLLVTPSPLSSTAESLMSKTKKYLHLGNPSMDVLELQHLFSKIANANDHHSSSSSSSSSSLNRITSLNEEEVEEDVDNEEEEEEEEKRVKGRNNDIYFSKLNVSKETPCGPLTAYVGSQREAALALCGWSPLLASSTFVDSMIDPQTGEPYTSIDALAASVPIPLIKTCCLAAKNLEFEGGELVAATKHTGIERSAAIALFHGFSGIAVQLLQLTASSIQERIAKHASNGQTTDASEGSVYSGASITHAELLQLVAMAAAGCPGPVISQYNNINDNNSRGSNSTSQPILSPQQQLSSQYDANTQQRDASRSVWLSSCRTLLNKVDGRRHPYLKVMLTVLVEVSDPAINKRVTPMPDKHSSKVSSAASADNSESSSNWNSVSKLRNQTPHRIDTLYPQLVETSRGGGISLFERERERGGGGGGVSLASPKQQHNLLSTSVTARSPLHVNSGGALLQSASLITASGQGLATPKQNVPEPLIKTPFSDPSRIVATEIDASLTPEDQIEISLQDRVAFACRFLDDASLAPYIRRITAECLATGRIDGLLLTGLTPKGSTLVQNYLDRRASSVGGGDVQTAAIVGIYFLRAAQLSIVKKIKLQHALGVPSPPSISVLSLLTSGEIVMVRRAWRWILEYRALLNKWQLWSQRALFDVHRSKILGYMYKPGKTTAEGGGLGLLPSLTSSSVSITSPDVYSEKGIADLLHNCCLALSTIEGVVLPSEGGISSSSSSSSSSSVQLSFLTLPLNNQAFLRCSSCHTSLHLPSLVDHSATAVEWLRKQRPRMLLCPSCGKSLPRCELCLLPLGCINPVMQLQHELSIRNAPYHSGSGKRGITEQEGGRLRDSSRLEDFWSFCNSCKHGGHSSHLAEWFATKTVCPVAECMCQCTLQDRR
jgi:hypothetical protein